MCTTPQRATAYAPPAAANAYANDAPPPPYNADAPPAYTAQAQEPAAAMRAAMAANRQSFLLSDPEGNNHVDRIERVRAGFKIVGRNNADQERFLILHDNGKVSGYDGHQKDYSPHDRSLGIVGHHMYAMRKDIFEHFGSALPEAHAPRGNRPAT